MSKTQIKKILRKHNVYSFELFAELNYSFKKAHLENTIVKNNLHQPKVGLCVDGSTINGNPGDSEYRIVDLETGKEVLREKIGFTSNNVTEFLVLVEAMIMRKEMNQEYLTIYSDSKIAIGWVHKMICNTSFPGDCSKRIIEALEILETLSKKKIMFWNKYKWGEIPADFGRK